ncbi:GNAT family N-acetyltransferase [Cohnella rhizosphaerae]|uniref:GNAT family N-acetyltransferase n=1 Tax=Cohnella rhizosphaerae TaxID=1457232 RepID=A0A9X4KWY5_9BACL|nr:GNAT family N-acetyltransferase [Cohnella rhizosphaerae]MDG0811876.1 GNAT family N-acetyltransferase [Cohnella rhizosphaerae]
MNQSFESTLDGQREWFEDYLTRDNDIYWVILNRRGDFVGTTALYNIDFVAMKAEKGRLITDEAIAVGGPFVLEAELLLLHFAFKELGLKTIYTTVRDDNVKMQSVNRKLGFEYKYTIDIRDVPYHYYELSLDVYNPEPFEPILEHWRKRYERAKA